MSAEDQVIHYLKDRVGLVGADSLVAQLKRETSATVALQQAELDVARKAAKTLKAELDTATEHGAVLSAEVDRLRGELERYRRANATQALYRIVGDSVLGELFAGELSAAKSSLREIRMAAQHGSMDDVRQALASHEQEERDGLAEQQKRDGHTGRSDCDCPWCFVGEAGDRS